MAGGTFQQQNKVLPGAYYQVGTSSLAPITANVSGVVTMPLALTFGESHKVLEVTANTNFNYTFGNDTANERSLMLLQEALKGASKVLVYNLSRGDKATANVLGDASAVCVVTAKYVGTRGNDIKIVISNSLYDPLKYEVTTYLDTTYIDKQTVSIFSELKDNQMVTFDVQSDGVPTITAGVPLTGGKTEEVADTDYMDYLDAIDSYQFNTMGIVDEKQTVIQACMNYVKDSWVNHGKLFSLYVGGTSAVGVDSEQVSIVENGVILADGTTLTNYEAVAWVAGASAGAGVANSLTYSTYPNAVDVTPRLSQDQQIDALQKGGFVFIEKRGTAVVLQDINTLVNFTVDKNQEFHKNKIIRILSDFINDTKISFEDNFIGKVPNNVDGRELFKSDRLSKLRNYEAQGAIENVVPEDIEIEQGQSKESVVMRVGIQPVDAMEKLYFYVDVY